LSPGPVPAGTQRHCAYGVDGQRRVHPPGKPAVVAYAGVVAAWQNGETRAGSGRALEDDVGQSAARVTGHDDVVAVQLDAIEPSGKRGDSARQPWPGANQRRCDRGTARRKRGIHDQRRG
jgi:hypothetical protein